MNEPAPPKLQQLVLNFLATYFGRHCRGLSFRDVTVLTVGL